MVSRTKYQTLTPALSADAPPELLDWELELEPEPSATPSTAVGSPALPVEEADLVVSCTMLSGKEVRLTAEDIRRLVRDGGAAHPDWNESEAGKYVDTSHTHYTNGNYHFKTSWPNFFEQRLYVGNTYG